MARRLDCGFRLSPWIEVHLLKSLSENGAELETTFDKPTTQDLLRIQFYELIRFFFCIVKTDHFWHVDYLWSPSSVVQNYSKDASQEAYVALLCESDVL